MTGIQRAIHGIGCGYSALSPERRKKLHEGIDMIVSALRDGVEPGEDAAMSQIRGRLVDLALCGGTSFLTRDGMPRFMATVWRDAATYAPEIVADRKLHGKA